MFNHIYNQNSESQSLNLSKLSNNQLSNDEESQGFNHEYSNAFQSKVKLKKAQLIKLIQQNEFEQKVIEYNAKGIELMRQGHVKKACLLASQAQKILQYAANMGQQINRKLIITVLHNLANCYQKTWDIQKCSNYIEAIIYNYNCSLLQISDYQHNQAQINIQKATYYKQIALYYLLFCAFTSQSKNNDSALLSAKKANQVLKLSTILWSNIAQKSKNHLDQKLYNQLYSLSKIKTNFQNYQFNQILQITQNLLYNFNHKCSFPTNNHCKTFSLKYKYHSIETILNLQPLNLLQKDLENEINEQTILQRIIMISISYFMMATELRFIAMKIGKKREQYSMYPQYRQSQIYHLISISIILYYFSFKLQYLQDILMSYDSHYQNILNPIFNKTKTNSELFDALLQKNELEQIDKKKNSSTTVNSVKQGSSDIKATKNIFQNYKININQSKIQRLARQQLKNQQKIKNKITLKKIDINNNNQRLNIKKKIILLKSKSKSKAKSINSSINHRNKQFISLHQSKYATPLDYTSQQISLIQKKSLCKSNSKQEFSQNKNKNIEQPRQKLSSIKSQLQYFNLNLQSKSKQKKDNYPNIIEKQNINKRMIKKDKKSKEEVDLLRQNKAKMIPKGKQLQRLRSIKSDDKLSKRKLQSKTKKMGKP